MLLNNTVLRTSRTSRQGGARELTNPKVATVLIAL
jgi:hypothetical protein